MDDEVDPDDNVGESKLMLGALDGFLIFVSKSGGIIYISDNVEQSIGISQVSTGSFTCS